MKGCLIPSGMPGGSETLGPKKHTFETGRVSQLDLPAPDRCALGTVPASLKPEGSCMGSKENRKPGAIKKKKRSKIVRNDRQTWSMASKKEFLRNSKQLYLEKAMAPHSITLAWKIPWAEEPGRLQSMGS